jgi:hypothetical protein
MKFNGSRRGKDGNTSGIVAAIFKFVEALKQYGDNIGLF